jgi:small subunit ribosomal protein S9
MAELRYYYGLGRRKSATASARLYAGKGKLTINDKPATEYLNENKTHLAEITDPLALVNKQKDFDVTIVVKAIAKALTTGFSDLRPVLKKAEFLKRDSREKERKKYGLRSARKREQFSKR